MILKYIQYISLKIHANTLRDQLAQARDTLYNTADTTIPLWSMLKKCFPETTIDAFLDRAAVRWSCHHGYYKIETKIQPILQTEWYQLQLIYLKMGPILSSDVSVGLRKYMAIDKFKTYLTNLEVALMDLAALATISAISNIQYNICRMFILSSVITYILFLHESIAAQKKFIPTLESYKLVIYADPIHIANPRTDQEYELVIKECNAHTELLREYAQIITDIRTSTIDCHEDTELNGVFITQIRKYIANVMEYMEEFFLDRNILPPEIKKRVAITLELINSDRSVFITNSQFHQAITLGSCGNVVSLDPIKIPKYNIRQVFFERCLFRVDSSKAQYILEQYSYNDDENETQKRISKQEQEIVEKRVSKTEQDNNIHAEQPKKISKKGDLKKSYIAITIAGMICVLGVFLRYTQYNKSRKNQGYNKIASNNTNKML